jgi:mono/diheme cytochrome c family protein
MNNTSLGTQSIQACKQEKIAPETARPFKPMIADRFITFVNTQASLPAGHYNVQVSAERSLNSFSYTLTGVIPAQTKSPQDSETTLFTFNGEWTSTADPVHSFTLNQSGGINISLTGPEGASMQLIKGSTPISRKQTIENSAQVLMAMPLSKISSEAYTQAYYQKVDPQNTRTTLQGWLSVNDFDQNDATHVVFRDTKDLGYGRSMFVRKRSDGGIAVYVDNYIVKLDGPSPANYSVLNVHAAVEQNRKYHASTNAIEFSPIDEADPSSPKVTKFFTFAKADESGIQHRVHAADLDGRGVKPVPTTCISCHGGALLPLDSNGKFPEQSLYTTKFNLLELNSFEYSREAGFSRQDQEQAFAYLNSLIEETYQEQHGLTGIKGQWSGSFAIEVAAGHYDNSGSSGSYSGDFVPTGWQQNGQRPAGVEALYLTVVRPHCISCHSLRGTAIGESTEVEQNGQTVSFANSVNFSSYEKFVGYSDRIIDYVYKRGQMPLSLRNYEKFWANPQGIPAFLASFLPGFDVVDENNLVKQPSRPFAKISHSKSMLAPGFLIGEHSLFATSYQWSLVSAPDNAAYQLGDLTKPNLAIESATPGDYSFSLQVTNDAGENSAVTHTTITIAEDLAQPSFENEIREILGSANNGSCSECHRADGNYPGIPAYYSDSNPDAYYDVKSRLDFADPENSPLLIKPTSLQHGGGIFIDRSTLDGENKYQQLLTWILAGAPCGSDPQFCS